MNRIIMMIMIPWAHPLKMMIVNPILRPIVQKVAVNRQALQRHGIF